MNNEKELLTLAEYLKIFSKLTGEQLMKTLDPIAKVVDRDMKVGNLGNNAVVNALAYVLDIYIARMSSYDRPKEEDDLYNKIHEEHGQYLHELISKYSSSKKSFLVKVEEEDKNDS